MKKAYDYILRYYCRKGLEDILLYTIQKEFGNESVLTPDDNVPIDLFHVRGRKATVKLVGLLGTLDGLKAFDVGCELSGTAR